MPPLIIRFRAGGLYIDREIPDTPPPPSGDYSYLAPSSTTIAPINIFTGSPMAFNGSTGKMEGTSVDVTEPTWAFTVTITDSGVEATNLANTQAAIDAQAAGMTGNTKIVFPADIDILGGLRLRSNQTGFTLGLVPAVTTGFPAIGNPASYGTKANRITPSHFALQWNVIAQGANEPAMWCDAGHVRNYWIRGPRFVNPLNRVCAGMFYMGPSTFSTPTVASSTSNSIVFQAGAGISHLAGCYLWLHRGAGAGATVGVVLRTTTVTGDGGATPTLGIVQTISSALDSTSQLIGMAGPAVTPHPTPSQLLPENLVLVQPSADGGGANTGAAGGVVRAYYGYGRKVAVRDGYTRNLGELGRDSQDFFIAVGEGPFSYENNDSAIGGPRENVIIGGSSLPTDTDIFLPKNVVLRGNATRGIVGATGKAGCVEIKYGRYVLIDTNYTDDSAPFSFRGAVVIKLTDQGGPNPATDTQHIMVRNNKSVNNSNGTLQLTSIEYYTGSNKTRNIDVINNAGRSNSQFGFQIAQYMDRIRMVYNTQLTGSVHEYPTPFDWVGANQGGYIPSTNVENRYNVWAADRETTFSFGTWIGGADTLYPSPSITAPNVLTSNAAAFADQVRFAGGFGTLGFVNLATGNWRLAAGAPGRGAAPAGKDFGANIDLLDALIADVF